MRRLARRACTFFVVLAVVLARLMQSRGFCNPSSTLLLRFSSLWELGGASGKQVLVKAGGPDVLPVAVSGREFSAAAGVHSVGEPVSLLRGPELLGSGVAGENGLSFRLSSPVSDGEVLTEVRGLRAPVLKVVGGYYHTLSLLSNGRVLSWGDNQYGQLGDGTTESRSVPGFVLDPSGKGPLGGVVDIATYGNRSVAVLFDGRVLQWGASVGRLPTAVSGLSEVVQVAAGSGHVLALLSDGRVAAWGYNDYGQLGDGTLEGRSYPVMVKNLPAPAVKVAAGWQHSMALLSDGKVATWGLNQEGELGNGDFGPNRLSASPVVVLSGGAVDVAAGGERSFALMSDGRVRAWGDNYNRRLGVDTANDPVARPVYCVLGPGGSGYLQNVVRVHAGSDHCLAFLKDGTLWSWGWNAFGQLGDGTTADRQYPVRVTNLPAALLAGAGIYHSLALSPAATLLAWGKNDYGQLGIGTTGGNYPSPQQVQLGP